MSSQKPPVPKVDFTKGTTFEEQVYGDELPYFDFDKSLLYQTKASLLRFIKPFNPFAVEHVSNDDHVGKLS